MIVDVVQKLTNYDMTWIAEVRGRRIAAAAAPFTRGRMQIEIQYDDGRSSQRLYHNPADTRWGKSLADRLCFHLFEGGDEPIGRIFGNTRKIGFLKSYAYYALTHRSESREIYEVGLGKDGLYLCLYRGDELLTIVEKDLTVINYQDVYHAYLKDQTELSMVLPFLIYYDVTAYGDLMETSVRSRKVKYVYTQQKELISKYDPSFIPRIRSMDQQSE